MNTLNRLSLFAVLACVSAFSPAFAQTNLLTATTLSAAALATDNVIYVTSATGINAPNPGANIVGSELYVISPGNPRGEVMMVRSVSSTAITVRRGAQGSATAIPSGAAVVIGQPNWYRDYDPSGGCTTAATYVAPHINTKSGYQWLCSPISLSWTPSWGSPFGTENSQPTVAVASVAGATAINSPLQHITGTNAITSFTMGVGWAGESFCVIPDGAFTTTATNNILKASTAVAAKTLCFQWDATNSGFTPSY